MDAQDTKKAAFLRPFGYLRCYMEASLAETESSHIVWLDLSGTKDWDLLPIIVGGDWTFVTRNSIDFRGPASSPGSRGQYTRVDLHAGLVCLNGPDGLTRDLQIELFGHALRELAAAPDLINQVLEITLEVGGDVRVARYKLPNEC